MPTYLEQQVDNRVGMFEGRQLEITVIQLLDNVVGQVMGTRGKVVLHTVTEFRQAVVASYEEVFGEGDVHGGEDIAHHPGDDLGREGRMEKR